MSTSSFTPKAAHQLHASVSHPTLRDWLQDGTSIHPSNLVYPIFIVDGEGQKQEIPSLPQQYRWSVDRLGELLEPLVQLGLKAVLLFGVPQNAIKDERGTAADDVLGPVCQGVKYIRTNYPSVLVICDVCLCAYTSHGHCCIFDERHEMDNQKSIDRLAEVAFSYAQAGAQIVAPSDMMDGRIGAIKTRLLSNGYAHVSVMSYAIKFASCFYGPFRDAAKSAPAFGDRKTYQLPPGSRGVALRALERDIQEGADMVMIKPGMPYLDLIRDTAERTTLPVAVYQVSGEFAMLHHAAAAGSFDLKAAVMESLQGFRRAGATIIITYFTPVILEWIRS
eukprot:TRINITY_DN3457_c0_g1_i1.p1 TRINITY_DN3457_c0_g1~~TRINITY_DN3457_c0_g1_i1.p1  ORF type:complete len:335 (-),score=64.38 TRINITY_DN3457_c0_g1_i1:142-1146(-)